MRGPGWDEQVLVMHLDVGYRPFGRFNWNDCQWAPLSKEMNMPNSVPA